MTAMPLVSELLMAQNILQNPMVLMFIVVVALPVVFMSLFGLIRDLRKQEVKRVDDRLMGRKPRQDQKSEEELKKSLIKKSAIAAAGGSFFQSFAKFRPVDSLQKACFQADLDWNAARLVMRLSIASGGLFVILMLFQFRLVSSLIICVPIFLGPIFYINFLKKRRLYALVEQLPEVFDALVSALRAGQSLPAAIGVVSEQLPEPSRTEFGLVFYEQNLGVRLEDALGNMRDRLDQMDVNFFVTSVQIQKQSGGDLAEVLEKIGSIIRERVKLFGQVKVLTAEGRMSGAVLLVLPPFMLGVITLLNPEYADQLFLTSIGNKLLVVSGVSEVLGWLLIKKIVDIKV